MPEIRVAQIIEATTGGTRRHLADLVTHLDRERFRVTVICSTRRDPAFLGDVDRFRRSGIEVRVVPMVREISPLRDLAALLRIRRILRAGAFDVVHTHSSKAGFVGRVAARMARVPAILHTAHVFPFLMDASGVKRMVYTRAERFAASMTDRFICVCRQEKDAAIRALRTAPDRMEIIENGIDAGEVERASSSGNREEKRHELGIGPADIVVGTAGRLTRQKGCAHFVRAAQRVRERRPGAKFVIAGNGELRAGIDRLVSSLSLRDDVRMIGQTEEIHSYLSVFDIFVLPSLWEGLPYSLLEAMALRKPVVATRVGGVPDVVLPGVTGLLVEPADPAALAEAIVALAGDPALRERMGRSGRERVETHYRRTDMIDSIERLYERVLKDKRSRGGSEK